MYLDANPEVFLYLKTRPFANAHAYHQQPRFCTTVDCRRFVLDLVWNPKNRPMLHICGLLRTVMALSFRTDRSGQTKQNQMRLFLEQSGQGLNYLRHFELRKLLIYRLVGNCGHRYSKHRACWRRFSCFPISSTK